MIATPISEPPFCLLLMSAIFDLQRARQLQFVEAEHAERQQHEQDREVHRIHGFWNAACRFAPASPATTPAIVKTTHVAST